FRRVPGAGHLVRRQSLLPWRPRQPGPSPLQSLLPVLVLVHFLVLVLVLDEALRHCAEVRAGYRGWEGWPELRLLAVPARALVPVRFRAPALVLAAKLFLPPSI